MPESSRIATPLVGSERILIIDALRGFAILGILLMNIPGFGLPGITGGDPTLMNEIGTVNYKVWYLVEWIPEGTQRAIFSMLFGAGIILFTSRMEKKLDGVRPADYFIRRQLWLIAFGLLDVYLLLWAGDILFDYGCYGIIMYAFRKLPVKGLLIGAGICCLLMIARENRDLYQAKKIITKGETVAAIDTTKTKLSELQKDDLAAMTEFKESNSREKKLKRMERAIRNTTGNYERLYESRTESYLNLILHYSYMGIWDVLLFMFLGMAFLKNGILTGQSSSKIYWLMAIAGLGLGLLISYYRLAPLKKYNYDWYAITKNAYFELYTVSRTLRSLGVLGVLMLLYKSGWFKWLFALMRPVGQMAFTNYLTQSLICGLFFYGIGWAMYGQLKRVEIYYFVAAIWFLQICWSHAWLRYFRFGPMEWLWRSLTYWKKQPFKKK